MEEETIEILSDAVKEYYGDYELEELCSRFGMQVEYQGAHPNHKKIVSQLIVQKYHTNHQRFLETILPKLLRRCEERILNTTWDVNVFDEQMLPHLKKLQQLLLKGDRKSSLKSGPVNRFFTSRADLVKFFADAQTALTIVDTPLGEGTLECIRGVQTPIRIMTAMGLEEFSADFGRRLSALRAKGLRVEIRRHLKMSDRFVIFNGRCWMVSCPLVDVGRVTLSIIECVDTKPAVVKEIGKKWREAKVYRR